MVACSWMLVVYGRAFQPDFSALDRKIAGWVDSGYYSGASLILSKDGRVIYEKYFGGYWAGTVAYIASAGKWLPARTDRKGDATLRQLLSHTAGYPDYQPGRMAELATGKSWETLFQEKIGRPLDMSSTHFTPVDTTQGHNPMLGGGARTALRDYSHFLQMIADGGMFRSKRVLSESSIREMQADQVGAARVGPGEYVSRVREALGAGHPYLFLTSEVIGSLKERIRTDTAVERSWQSIRAKADEAVATGRGGDMGGLCLAYRMTGDNKYAQRAKALLVQLVNGAVWDGMDDRTPRWNAGLGTARGCFTSALGFDCLYDYLTAEERKDIAGKIVRLGIEPSIGDWISSDKRIHSLNSMGHNWWSAVVYEAGVASLAVMNEIPQARGWAEEVLRQSTEWFAFSGSVLDNKPVSFDADGGFYESIGYASFGISEYLLFRLAWTHAIAPVHMPYDSVLVKTMDWFIHGSYPNTGPLQSLNFGDSNPFANAQKSMKLMIALGFKKESFYWYLQQTETGGSRSEFGRNDPLGLVYSYGPVKAPVVKSPGLSASFLYKDMGWATLRSSWDTNATLLGVKSGFTWNHAHADAGSFVLYHKGKNLLIDGGDCYYGADEYSNYFVRSEAHNVVLFNGKAQDPQDQYYAVKNPGHLYHLMDGGDIKYVLADAQGPTAHYFLRNYRSFLWVGKVILVIDDVKAYEPGKFEWLMHFDQEAKRSGPDFEITNGNAAVLVRPLFPETLPMGYPHDFPEKMVVEQRLGYKDHDVKTRIPYYAISPPEVASQQKFINAIILLDDENKPLPAFTGSSGASGGPGRSHLPQIEKLEGKDFIGVRIRQDGKVTEVYFNLLADGRLMHRNSNNVINGWETDAYMMAVSGDADKVQEYFIGNGSYLRRGDRVVLHSLSKVFMIASDGVDPKVILQGQPVMHVELQLKEGKRKVIDVNENGVNGTWFTGISSEVLYNRRAAGSDLR